VTEEEARDKFCPQTFGALGRADMRATDFKCCGSDCMAWRLAERMFGEVTNNGFCGLAGRP